MRTKGESTEEDQTMSLTFGDSSAIDKFNKLKLRARNLLNEDMSTDDFVEFAKQRIAGGA